MTEKLRTAFTGLSGALLFGPWEPKHCKYRNWSKDCADSIKRYNKLLIKHSVKHKMSKNKEAKFIDFTQKKCYYMR